MTANNCAPKYFTNKNQVGLKLGFVPVNGFTATGYVFEVYNPFVIVGMYGQSGAVPNGGVGDATYSFLGSPTLAAFPYQELAQNMMVANRDGANQSGFLTYMPNDNGADFSGYFLRNMQEGLEAQNFGDFIFPHFLARKFWEDYLAFSGLATFDGMRVEHFQRFCKGIYTDTDLRLWNAPGIYSLAGAPPNTDGYYADFDTAFSGGSVGDSGLIVAQVKPVE